MSHHCAWYQSYRIDSLAVGQGFLGPLGAKKAFNAILPAFGHFLWLYTSYHKSRLQVLTFPEL